MVKQGYQALKQHFLHNNRIKEYSGYGGKINALGWNNAGNKLASACSDKSVNVFTIESSRLVSCFNSINWTHQSKPQTFRGHTDSVDKLAWHPTSNDILATVGADGTVRIWDCRSRRTTTAQLKGENINIAWSPDANYVAVGNKTDLVSSSSIHILWFLVDHLVRRSRRPQNRSVRKV